MWKFSEGRRIAEEGGWEQIWKNKGDIPDVKELPLLFTVVNPFFCHLKKKWQKRAKPTVTSGGILFFRRCRVAILIRSLFCKFGDRKSQLFIRRI